MPKPVPDFAALAASGLRDLSPYVPGKPMETLAREYGISDSIKLASNESPLGPPPAAVTAMRAAMDDLALYPDGEGYALKQALAEKLGVDPAQITLGNGSNELLVLVAETFLDTSCTAVVDQHGFVIYALSVRATGATVNVAPSLPADRPQQALGHDPNELWAAVDDKTRLLFIANPNNPTGTWLSHQQIRELLIALPGDIIVVLDEAYAEYVTDPDYADGLSLLDEFPQLLVTRTFSKIHGLAGLRIGYGISHPALAELLNRIRQPFNTNSLAQAAAIAALGDEDHVSRSREMNARGRDTLAAGLSKLGFQVIPSQGNFLLARIGTEASELYEHLLRAGIIVRPVANYGLPEYLRITVGLPEQNERLLVAAGEWSARETSG